MSNRTAALVLVFTLVLSACGSDDDGATVVATSTSTGSGSTSSTTATTTAVPTTATTAVPTPVTAAVLALAPDGIGPLRLGMPRAAAEQTRMIGLVAPGCELSGTSDADLLPPLVGGVDFSSDGKLQSVELRSGATTAEGVAPTATIEQIRHAYDGRGGFAVDRDDSTEEVFGIFLVKASKGGASYTFVFESKATRATSVVVPAPSFCD